MNKKQSKLNLKINHRNWEEALALAFAYLISADPGEVVCIVGPSRAGKTRLILELCKLLFGNDVFSSNSTMPAVIVDATNESKHGTFSTKDFMWRILKAINHPLLSMGADANGIELLRQKMDRITESTLRGAVESGFIARKAQYFFIDESHHIKYVSKDAVAPSAVMDSLKCLAKEANVVLVIVGAYPILDIMEKSVHLLGRKHQVHLPRYLPTAEDLTEFAGIVNNYEQQLTICSSLGSLNNCIELLYTYSLGCIGLLRAWLKRAQAMASISGGGITKSILMKTRLSDSDISKISEEILNGENALLNRENTEDKSSVAPNIPPTKNKTKPFQRKPRRMKAGNRMD